MPVKGFNPSPEELVGRKIRWADLTCIECPALAGLDPERFPGGGDPAVFIIWHERDRKAYPMCAPCGYHNTNNRGGIVLARKEN